ncbi:hypothetical protein EN858_26025 [Mesorhizobium sp. M4B.F.Ca.ET.215.01.1.1]|uniref:hypothetical protein n=1 Tax=unclassified Mesorhizobium TaxID=325217 RepID=UPI000FCA7759|nr:MULTISPECIES: hypothetical protein [unclassified Mesorhizobium]RUW26696.1 hypothetical protein EOA34_07450 [Mesorhizobium sp. M4B.F.Ca.ET.013.02.1.1]RVD42655.1 hypothetical protein EN741_11630 [Mesorhizobium sp. M4B.F.Ca.ET.019.03.1.1]RWC96898.1 MAG: hypothetical protein EOS32_06240 [Mesorhizobium sp.]RWF64592.1 MAG: hypothetical protein EOS47_14370 [Mesorhizobium sp.]TGQ07218.1 hypothetical protein EN858_26025 [Mesorhizobium sp. M4B.F.Ca.ET.215.01.1.1]
MAMLASLISALASGEALAALGRARTAAVVYIIVTLAAMCGVGFLIGAAYIWIAGLYGPMAASLGFGVGFLVIAGSVLIVYRLSAGLRARRRARQRSADMKALGITAALAALPVLLKGKGGLGAVLAPAIALAAYAIYRENAGPDRDADDAD